MPVPWNRGRTRDGSASLMDRLPLVRHVLPTADSGGAPERSEPTMVADPGDRGVHDGGDPDHPRPIPTRADEPGEPGGPVESADAIDVAESTDAGDAADGGPADAGESGDPDLDSDEPTVRVEQ